MKERKKKNNWEYIIHEWILPFIGFCVIYLVVFGSAALGMMSRGQW